MQKARCVSNGLLKYSFINDESLVVRLGFLNKWRTAGLAGKRDSLVADQINLIETKKP